MHIGYFKNFLMNHVFSRRKLTRYNILKIKILKLTRYSYSSSRQKKNTDFHNVLCVIKKINLNFQIYPYKVLLHNFE